MNRKRRNLIAIIVMITALMAPMFGMIASASTPDHPGIADNTTRRTITVWKYVLENLGDAGDRGDGTFTAPPAEAELFIPTAPNPGVEFVLRRVIPLPINAAWAATPNPPPGGWTLQNYTGPRHALVNPTFQTENAHWVFDTTFAAVALETGHGGLNAGQDGRVIFDLGIGRANDGIYIITESSHPEIVRPVDPFFVHVPQTRRTGAGALETLIYDIVVQPKNVQFTSLNPVKTINGATHNTHITGNVFRWELQSDIPADLTTVMPEAGYLTRTIRGPAGTLIEQTIPVTANQRVVADFFEIRDVFHSSLNVLMAAPATPPGAAPRMQARMPGPTPGTFGPWVDLPTTYFTVTAAGGNPNDITFALTTLGKTNLSVGGHAQIRALVYTHADVGFNGVIQNTFTVQYNGPDWRQTPGDYPQDPEYPEILPIYYTGGFRIRKAGPTGVDLPGAVFRIATCTWNFDADGNRTTMIASALENARAGRFLASNGNHYLHTATPTPPATWLQVTSNAQGEVAFNGLPLQPHSILGFVPQTPLSALQHDQLDRIYYLVEIEAPAGYELLRAPHQVNVTTTTHLDDFTVLPAIINQRTTDLPFTGGMGTVLIVVIAMSVIGLSVVIYAIDKKRRRG